MADLEMVQRRLEKAQKYVKSGEKKYAKEADLMARLAAWLNEGKSARSFPCEGDEADMVAQSDLLSLKPVIYTANMDEDGFAQAEQSEYYKQVKAIADAEGSMVLPVCARFEQDIAELEDPADREMFMEELGIRESGLERLIKCSYSLLGLISFLTCGPDECRAWTITKGTKAPQAAGKIHTDFERGFIRANIIAFEDLKACGSEAAAREKGLLRAEGKEYVMQDGDVTHFLFNV